MNLRGFPMFEEAAFPGALPMLAKPELAQYAAMPQSHTLRGEDIVYVDNTPYRRHPRGGGLVALTATVANRVVIAKTAMVKDHAVVVGNVRLFDRVVIEDRAIVADGCTLRGDSSVGGDAVLRGSVQLSHQARVDGAAHLSGNVKLQHYAHVRQGTLVGGLVIH